MHLINNHSADQLCQKCAPDQSVRNSSLISKADTHQNHHSHLKQAEQGQMDDPIEELAEIDGCSAFQRRQESPHGAFVFHVDRLTGKHSHQDRQDQCIDQWNVIEGFVPFLLIRRAPVKQIEIIQQHSYRKKQKGVLVPGFFELDGDQT